MVHEPPRRTAISGPALVRLLARLTDANIQEPRLTLADCLSQWLGWSDAIALSGVLGAAAPAPRAATGSPASDAQDDCERLRAAIEQSIAGLAAPKPPRQSGSMQRPRQTTAAARPATDYGTYRRAYASVQRAMESGIAPLRVRLRTRLASHSPGMARLALVDATMEQALAPREYKALTAIPGLLEKHFERLRQAEEAALADAWQAGQAAPFKPGAWLDMFRRDMQSVLRAELDIRLQPLEGLLAACRIC